MNELYDIEMSLWYVKAVQPTEKERGGRERRLNTCAISSISVCMDGILYHNYSLLQCIHLTFPFAYFAFAAWNSYYTGMSQKKNGRLEYRKSLQNKPKIRRRKCCSAQ